MHHFGNRVEPIKVFGRGQSLTASWKMLNSLFPGMIKSFKNDIIWWTLGTVLSLLGKPWYAGLSPAQPG